MARVQLLIPDDERGRFAEQTRREGMTVSAWRFASYEDVEAFFRACDSSEGPETEPDWHEHLAIMAASRAGGEGRT